MITGLYRRHDCPFLEMVRLTSIKDQHVRRRFLYRSATPRSRTRENGDILCGCNSAANVRFIVYSNQRPKMLVYGPCIAQRHFEG